MIKYETLVNTIGKIIKKKRKIGETKESVSFESSKRNEKSERLLRGNRRNRKWANLPRARGRRRRRRRKKNQNRNLWIHKIKNFSSCSNLKKIIRPLNKKSRSEWVWKLRGFQIDKSSPTGIRRNYSYRTIKHAETPRRKILLIFFFVFLLFVFFE